MNTQALRNRIVEEATKHVKLGEGSDYKDYAEELHEQIGLILACRNRLASLFEDMPDGGACPRAFLAWTGSLCG